MIKGKRKSATGGVMMKFVAVDVETANSDMASICQVGIAIFENQEVKSEWKTYINPEDYFDEVNSSIHGIDGSLVRDAPTFPEVAPQLLRILAEAVCVCHTHFDRKALERAFNRYEMAYPRIQWLDTARVARRTWNQCSERAYGLKEVAKLINYAFHHHDALEDAKAAGHILVAALKETGFTLEEWLRRVEQPIRPTAYPSTIARSGNPAGPLYGEVLVFTGELRIVRREAADMAAALGCRVAAGVTKDTTMLIVGDQDIGKLAGHMLSSKHRKALEMIRKGAQIRILKESDFARLFGQ